MSIADLFSVPKTDQEWKRFSMANMDHHLLVTNFLNASKSKTILIPPLDPISFVDISNWENRHQASHNDIDDLLNIPGYDFTDLDVKKPLILAQWIWNHATEHYQQAVLTGIW